MKKKNKITERDKPSRIDELLKSVSLETRIRIDIQCFFLNKYGGSFFISIDENGVENEEQIAKNQEIMKECSLLIQHINDSIKQWKIDKNITEE